MKKRTFLKTSCVVAVGACCGIPMVAKRYVTATPWDQVVGVCIEWSADCECPNPHPGKDWKVIARCPERFFWKGEWIHNWRMNKFIVEMIPFGKAPVLFCFDSVPNHFGIVDLSERHGMKFYRI